MKPLKITLLVLGPIALIVGIYLAMAGRSSGLASRVTLLDVTTGQTKTVSAGSIKFLPAPNESGVMALFPVIRNEAGQWEIPDRYRDALRDLAKENQIQIDPETLTLANAP